LTKETTNTLAAPSRHGVHSLAMFVGAMYRLWKMGGMMVMLSLAITPYQL